MLNLRLSDIAACTNGHLHGDDAVIHSVTTDSRTVAAGALFIALRGEQFDAHDFVAAAAVAGAQAALVERAVEVAIPQVIVADTQIALGEVAGFVRRQRNAKVIGITGSNGKTTVKTLVANILGAHGRTHVNAGNFNNEIGLPLTLLAMPEDSDYAVLEMGAGKPGDIDYLARIARPDVGLVNNIAPAHLERMGTLDRIAETKGALYTALPDDGIAIINADEAYANFFTRLAGARRVIRFGLSAGADITARDVSGSQFNLSTPAGQTGIRLPLPGEHNVRNALAAAAVATALDVPLSTIKRGLETAPQVAGRNQRRVHTSGAIVIDDSYNANPGSFAAAISTLASEPAPRILVMGDMRELGPDGGRLHAEIGNLAKHNNITQLHTVGELSRLAAEAFGAGAVHHANQEALVAALLGELKNGTTVLIKGSRGSAMDRVVRALFDIPAAGGGLHAA
jgi:UDP-N-acetylmuramoyl-tripeptide--D-alanyl-D-alanine ligase